MTSYEIETYLAFCLSTYNSSLTDDETIANCSLSCIGELLEWSEETTGSLNELLESGDVLYYLLILVHTVNPSGLSEWITENSSKYQVITMSYSQILSGIADKTKKHLYYSPTRYSREDYWFEVEPFLSMVLRVITRDTDLGDIIASNTRKLSDRYNLPIQRT